MAEAARDCAPMGELQTTIEPSNEGQNERANAD